MNQEAAEQEPAVVGVAPEQPASPPAGRGSRIGASVVLALIVISLLWYFAAGRLTPFTSQARVQAFVVPVAAEVAGPVQHVDVEHGDVGVAVAGEGERTAADARTVLEALAAAATAA